MGGSLSPQDKEDIELCHQFRLSLPSAPTQSSFRVLALLFYDDHGSAKSTLPPWVPQKTKDGRKYIVGTNDEPGYMGGAICAERSAMVQLRFVPSFRITKVVIATDSFDPIAPGMLCREFLAGHESVPWDAPVLSSGCICTECQLRDNDLFTGTKPCSQEGQEHSLRILQTTIKELYPFPSPYTRLTASNSVALGESFAEKQADSTDRDDLSEIALRLLELAVLEAKSNISDLHPIQFGAAVVLEDETIEIGRASCRERVYSGV